METLQRQTSVSGEARLTSSPQASPASLFPTQANGVGQRTSVTSGRRLAELCHKSGPLGSLVRMLLESSLWSKEGYALRWEVKPLCSERVETFMSSAVPTPSSESARSLRVSDIQSSRCLFQLVLSVLPTEGTECSSSPILLTPTTVMTKEEPEAMRARAEKNGYKNGTKYGSLETQVMYDPKVATFLKTPCAADAYTDNMQSKGISGTSWTLAQEIANGYVDRRGLMLPTPTAGEAEKYRLKYTLGSQMGTCLTALAASGMLPTPLAREWKPPCNPDAMQRKNGMMRDDQLSAIPTMLGLKERGGITFRLSPLFTQEMMGFPRLWTELPWVSQSGAPKASKPTATQ